MTAPFDWAGLAGSVVLANAGQGPDAAITILQREIEAAFVPKGKAHCETCGTDVAEVLCAKCGEWWRDNSPEVHEATARAEAAEAQNEVLEEALEAIVAATHSHIDGRDLLAELHPRRRLDIKRRVDGRETWFQADWLSELWAAIKKARQFLTAQLAEAGNLAARNKVLEQALRQIRALTAVHRTHVTRAVHRISSEALGGEHA